MPSWRKALPLLQTLVVRALVVLTVFILVYVGYAHVASLVSTREHKLASYDANLGSIEGLGRFGVAVHGDLHHAIEDGALVVHGTAPQAGRASIRFSGPEQSLDDVISARVRLRVLTPGAYDVFVGLERVHRDSLADEPRRVVAVMHVEKSGPATFTISGDTVAQGPRRLVERASPIPTDVTSDAGDEGHVLALEFAAYIRSVFESIDGVTTGSEQVRWFMGDRVRLVFGVEAREPSAPIRVAFTEASYEQHERPAKLASFDERFTGKLIDPRRWVPMLPDGVKGESSAIIEQGLHVRARSKGEPGFQPGMVLLTQPTPLDSFRIKARLDVRTLKGSSFILGVVGSGFTPPRFVDAVIRDDGTGKIEGVTVGHWSGDGQLNYQRFDDPWKEGEATLEIDYDVGPGEIEVRMDGKRQVRQKFDLLPGDTTQFRVGVQLQAADAVADVVIREVRFDR